jgi:cystathionine beta-lyase
VRGLPGAIELPSEAALRARPGRKWHQYAEDVLPAWIAEMDFGLAEPIRAALQRVANEESHGYEDNSLYPTLATAFATYVQRRYAWQPDPELVVPVADLVQALFTSVGAFTASGQGVVLQTPIYPPFQNAVRETGRHIVENRLTDDGSRFSMDLDALADVWNADAPLLLLCNPHNPTGRVFERSDLERIAELAVSRKLVVVADEVHADLAYAEARHIPFATISAAAAERTVTITSATKAYNIPGLRCGVMHFGSTWLRERFRAAFPDRMLGIVNRFGIEATLAAWSDTASSAWLSGVLDVLEANRTRMTTFFSAELPEVRWYPPQATYLGWLDFGSAVPTGASPQAYVLEHARVGLSEGEPFGYGGDRRARFNFGTSPDILDQMLGRLADALRR